MMGTVTTCVVGCDGAHSALRRLLAVGFSGRTYDNHILLADVRIAEDLPPAVGGFIGDKGVIVLPPYGGGWYRAVIWDRTRAGVRLDEPLGIEEVRDSMRRIGALSRSRAGAAGIALIYSPGHRPGQRECMRFAQRMWGDRLALHRVSGVV
jgi:2-polyprenyl-6-methoxyphenol hydroxylase-like FAD-dependent oxidoreductase